MMALCIIRPDSVSPSCQSKFTSLFHRGPPKLHPQRASLGMVPTLDIRSHQQNLGGHMGACS